MATDLTAADWAAMRARCDAATPDNRLDYWRYVRENLSNADYALLTSARTDLPLALDALARQQEANARLTNEMATFGLIEVAVRNVNVASYMNHWEHRTETAEAALADRDATIARLREALEAGRKLFLSYEQWMIGPLLGPDNETVDAAEAFGVALAALPAPPAKEADRG
jgi:hypothetical protein